MKAECTGPRRESKIGLAPHPDPAVGPGLVRNPIDGIVTVFGFIFRKIGFEHTFRAPLAANVLNDGRVPTTVPEIRNCGHRAVGLRLAIWQPREHGGKRPRTFWQIYVRRKAGTIAGADHHVAGHFAAPLAIGKRRKQLAHWGRFWPDTYFGGMNEFAGNKCRSERRGNLGKDVPAFHPLLRKERSSSDQCWRSTRLTPIARPPFCTTSQRA